MEFRIGVNLGDVMVEGEQIYGDGVNIAARLESLAAAGGICISGKVHSEVAGKLDLRCQDLGEQHVKNIAEPVRVWRVLLDGELAAHRQSRVVLPHPTWRTGIFSLAGLASLLPHSWSCSIYRCGRSPRMPRFRRRQVRRLVCPTRLRLPYYHSPT